MGGTGFTRAVEGGKGGEGAEEDGYVGEGEEEAEPVDHIFLGGREWEGRMERWW